MAGRAGAIAIYAGVGVLRGGPFAQAIGLAIVGFSAVRWFFFRPVAPWVAITVIALDVLVVCGLVAHSEYFDIDTAHQQRKSAAAPQQPRPNRRPHPPRRALVGADSPRA